MPVAALVDLPDATVALMVFVFGCGAGGVGPPEHRKPRRSGAAGSGAGRKFCENVAQPTGGGGALLGAPKPIVNETTSRSMTRDAAERRAPDLELGADLDADREQAEVDRAADA